MAIVSIIGLFSYNRYRAKRKLNIRLERRIKEALEKQKLEAEIENLKLKYKLQLLRIQTITAEAQADNQYSLPHRRYPTKVFRSPNGDYWVCVGYHVDRGDLYTDSPHGFGRTPAEACNDFDKNWTGESNIDDGDCFA